MSHESRLSTASSWRPSQEQNTSSHHHDQRLTDKTNKKWTQRSLLIFKLALAPNITIDLIIFLLGTISLGTSWREPDLDALHQPGVDLQADRHDVTGCLTPGDPSNQHELNHGILQVLMHQAPAVDGGKILVVGAKSPLSIKDGVKSNEPGRVRLPTVHRPPRVFSRVKMLTHMAAGADLCLSRLEEGTMSVETSFQLLKLYLVPAGQVFMSRDQ